MKKEKSWILGLWNIYNWKETTQKTKVCNQSASFVIITIDYSISQVGKQMNHRIKSIRNRIPSTFKSRLDSSESTQKSRVCNSCVNSTDVWEWGSTTKICACIMARVALTTKNERWWPWTGCRNERRHEHRPTRKFRTFGMAEVGAESFFRYFSKPNFFTKTRTKFLESRLSVVTWTDPPKKTLPVSSFINFVSSLSFECEIDKFTFFRW